MMDLMLLAQIEASQNSQNLNTEALNFIWQQITDLSWLHAVIAISVGLVYMLYGWRIFRVLVVISFGLGGMYLGMYAGEHFFGSLIWGGVLGLAVFAIIAVPLMKWCVSVLGAVAGGAITGSLWYAAGLPLDYIWAGAIIGVVGGGLMSFILLKSAVMLFTGLGGSILMMVGALSLVYQYETQIVDPPTQHVYNYIHYHQWFLPVVILVPMIIGMVVQYRFIKKSQEWEI